MSYPLVSCVMPTTANRAKYIPLAIKCFLAQTFTDSELVIVSDGEPMPIEMPKHERIRHVHLDGPQRITGTKRNATNEHAYGQFIFHWDDDDWSAPNRVEAQVKYLQTAKEQVLSLWSFPIYDIPTKKTYLYNSSRTNTYHYHVGATSMYRKSWWEEHRFPDTKAEDTAFAKQAEELGKHGYRDGRNLMVMRAHSDSDMPMEKWYYAMMEYPWNLISADFYRDIAQHG